MADQVGGDRYAGKPLLRALEFYVMSVIGRLDDETSALMDTWIRRTFRVPEGTSWEVGLERELELGASIQQSLRNMWEGYVEFHTSHGRAAEPGRFAMEVVDENFLPLINRSDSRD